MASFLSESQKEYVYNLGWTVLLTFFMVGVIGSYVYVRMLVSPSEIKEVVPCTTVKFDTLLVDKRGVSFPAELTIDKEYLSVLADGHTWGIMTPVEQ